jgi:phosphoribosyl 1,2-cyclic phosphodiesterase
VRVDLCGVRGSIPSPGAEFAGVGGNTSCLALSHDGEAPSLVLDAGTGLRRLTALLDGSAFRGTILLGHLHWDHIMGIPFFAAGDRPDAEVDVLIPEQGLDPLETLSRAMTPPLFPITPSQLRGRWKLGTYDEGELDLDGFHVLAREIPHSGGRTMGLRISDGSATIAYLSDHAPHNLGPGEHGLGELHPAALELCDGVDALFHDSQYTAEELAVKYTWGHAAAGYSVELAERCHVGTLFLFHHDPSRTDQQVHDLAASLRSDLVEVVVAVEGTSHHIGSR